MQKIDVYCVKHIVLCCLKLGYLLQRDSVYCLRNFGKGLALKFDCF